jgi:hypothetical protein
MALGNPSEWFTFLHWAEITLQGTKLQKQSIPERGWETETFAPVCGEC